MRSTSRFRPEPGAVTDTGPSKADQLPPRCHRFAIDAVTPGLHHVESSAEEASLSVPSWADQRHGGEIPLAPRGVAGEQRHPGHRRVGAMRRSHSISEPVPVLRHRFEDDGVAVPSDADLARFEVDAFGSLMAWERPREKGPRTSP